MPQELQALFGVSRDDFDVRIVADCAGQIVEFAVDANGDRVARQALADTGSDVSAGRRVIVLARGTIG